MSESKTFKKAVKRFRIVQERTADYVPARTISRSLDLQTVATELYAQEANHYQEHFLLMYLNRANTLVGYEFISRGGFTGTVVDTRIILLGAALSASCGIALCHNHPSGGTKPSTADERVTQQIKDAVKLIDVKLLDHIIITEDNGFFSFADEGLL